MGLGLEKVGLVGGELFKGPAFSVSKARHQRYLRLARNERKGVMKTSLEGHQGKFRCQRLLGWWIGQRLLMKLCWQRCPGTTILLHSLWGFGIFPFLFLLLVLAGPWW